MAEKLSSTNSDRLNAALDTWPNWQGGLSERPVVVSQLDGWSNESFLIAGDQVKLVLRLNGESVRFGVDRSLERYILKSLANRPFAPTLVYWDETLDFCVIRYVFGRQMAETELPERLGEIGQLFKHIHSTPLPLDTKLDPLSQVKFYFEQLTTPGPKLTRCYNAVLARNTTIGPDHCLCHHDLLLENIIDTERGLVALDWEYAGAGDPAFDLAVFMETYRLTAEHGERLLDAYDASANFAVRIDEFRLLYALIEILWWTLRDPDQPLIAEKLNRLDEQLS